MLDYIARQASLPPAERTASSASCESDSTRVVTSQDRTGAGCASGRQVKKREAPPSSILVLLCSNLLLVFLDTFKYLKYIQIHKCKHSEAL